MKPIRWSFLLLAGLTLGLLFADTGLGAQSRSESNAAAPKYRTNFMVYDVQKKQTRRLFSLEGEWHAPNWSPDGRYLVSDMGGSLYRIPMSGAERGEPEKIYASPKMTITNDHALAWDGRQVGATAIKLPMPAHPRGAADLTNPLLVMKIDGSAAREIHLGWLHGWSPDGRYLLYTGTVGDASNIYRIDADGGGELQMTAGKARDDGPEYSADGRWVYFCSKRSGKWDVWRMPASGAGPEDRLSRQITHGLDTQDWFPHLSRDGKWLYTISYPMAYPDHEYIGEGMKIKLLRLTDGLPARGAELTTVRTFFGGQGSGNTSGWSADSKQFAWTEYEKVPEYAR